MIRKKNQRRPQRVLGFTILELLIAAAASLLIMAALTRAFQTVGVSIKDSRAMVGLSADTRDFSFRLRSELNAHTASLDPTKPDDGQGYLVYYEGPLSSSSTSTVYGYGPPGTTATTYSSEGYLPLSRWGDNDDFLAFTAKAPADAPFTGIVPRGVLEAHVRIQQGSSYVLPAGYDPSEPTVITSQYAEIVYWVAPRIISGAPFASDNNDGNDGMLESGMPNYVDLDSNGLPNGVSNTNPDGYPDSLVLYRRTLLIRPDLNLTYNEIPVPIRDTSTFSASRQDQKVLCYLREVTPGTIQITTADKLVSPGLWSTTNAADRLNWLTGMANVQQQMDLSVAREFVLGTGNGVSTGLPSQVYSANNLEQLRSPHRRFAHVMMPGSLAIHASSSIPVTDGCSMPLLALSPPSRFLTTACTDTTSISGRLPITTYLTQSTPSTSQNPSTLADEFTLLGYLRPEYSLSGAREGEDILATNVVTFDVQAYDPGAPVFVAVGGDGQPGIAGFDDNADGTTDNFPELGASLSDDQVVTPNDPFAYYAVRDTTVARPVSKGAFIDLGYFLQPGGNIRGFADLNGGNPPGVYLESEYGKLADNEFSGINYLPITVGRSAIEIEISPSLRKSGKCLLRRNGQHFVQNTFDTWTSEYEHDGINQVPFDATPSRTQVDFNGVNCGTTYWVFNDPTNANPPFPALRVPANASGDPADPLTSSSVFTNGTLQSETSPPIESRLGAIRVVIENLDVATRQIIRSEVLHDFAR